MKPGAIPGARDAFGARRLRKTWSSILDQLPERHSRRGSCGGVGAGGKWGERFCSSATPSPHAISTLDKA